MSSSPLVWPFSSRTTFGCVGMTVPHRGIHGTLQQLRTSMRFSARFHRESLIFCWPSAPQLSNILPHLQTLISFITHTLPKPLLASLFYRLIILHLASRILPSIGSDAWDSDIGVDGGWEGRPVCTLCLAVFATPTSALALDFTPQPYSPHLSPIHLHHGVFSSIVLVPEPFRLCQPN